MRVFMVGANGGIGTSIKQLLLSQNIEVVSPTSQELDLSSDFTVDSSVSFDGMIYCSGVNYLRNHTDIDYTEFSKLLNINAISFVKLCSKLKLTNGSNIIAIGSLYADTTKELRLQYSSSKHAMLGMVQTLALELATRNIKVNMISPGFVDTPMTRQNNTLERIEYLNTNIPLGLVKTDDIAETCHWFLTKNNAITGQNIKVDGGYSLRGI